MTLLHRIAPDNIRHSLSSLSGAAVRHRRPLRVTAAAILAVTTVVAPVAAQAASAEPSSSHHSAQATDRFAAALSFESLASAQRAAEQLKGKTDLTQLNAAIEALQNNYSSDPAELTELTDAANSAVVLAQASAAGAEAGAKIAQAAVAKAAAAKAKAEAAARAKAAAEAKAAADAAAAQSSSTSYSSAVSVSPGSAQAIAQSMMASRYGWGNDQFQCLVNLWNRESGWSTTAGNASGAYGIPQALPGSKMASAGADWQTSASTQIAWGLGYISGSYGNPCNAWAHSQSTGWY